MMLVVGAEGLVGRALIQAFKESGVPAVGTGRKGGGDLLALDLAQPEKFQIPKGVRTAVVCAGMGGLAACASDPVFTRKVNVQGSASLAQALALHGCQVIYLSTNLVFDGDQPRPFSTDSPRPGCEYGVQKAELEKLLQGKFFACVRLTKVMESLRGRFGEWLASLRAGEILSTSTKLRFSPVSLSEVVRALAEFANKFSPGTFHISGDRDFSYQEAALMLAKAHSLPTERVTGDDHAGINLFFRAPGGGCLQVQAPPGCSGWRFGPSLSTMECFLKDL
jgi:dTDP-4-dehydrorhamnose reductase